MKIQDMMVTWIGGIGHDTVGQSLSTDSKGYRHVFDEGKLTITFRGSSPNENMECLLPKKINGFSLLQPMPLYYATLA